MKNFSKLNSSLFLIKRAHALYPNNIGTKSVAPPLPVSSPVPRAIPVSVAKPVPKAISVARPAPSTMPSPPQAANTVPPYYSPILDIIRKAESNVAGYDTMVGSNKPHGLTSMTLEQLMEYQKKHPKGSAAGAYQIINPTLRGLIQKMKIDPASTKYDQTVQDRMALELLKQRGFNKFLEGQLPLEKARMNLAKEWAGLPAAGGKSYYAGTGNNRANISEEEFLSSLNRAKQLYLSNTKQ